MASSRPTARLGDLPSDILILIFEYLPVDALSRLSRTCRPLFALVNDLGWSTHLRLHYHPAQSLSCTESIWSACTRTRYDTLAASSWARQSFIARPLCDPWPERLQPVLATSKTRLIVGAGNQLHSYVFSCQGDDLAAPGVQFEATYVMRHSASVSSSSMRAKADARQDIRSIVFVPDDDGEMDRTMYVGFADGALVRVTLPDTSKSPTHDVQTPVHIEADEQGIKGIPSADDAIQGLSSHRNMLLSLSASGAARLTNLSSQSHSHVELEARSWSTLLSCDASYAAFGTTSTTIPLVIHSITESQLSTHPQYILSTQNTFNTLLSTVSRAQPAPARTLRIWDGLHVNRDGNTIRPRPQSKSTAVYGLCAPPPSFPTGSTPGQVLISGWFDGFVRVYDLRSSKRVSSSSVLDSRDNTSGSAPHLAPVLSLSDPWSLDPIYAVSAGGSTGSNIAAGSARHSLLALWDVRSHRSNPRSITHTTSSTYAIPHEREGWSVHAPANDSSPVYDVIMESSRVFGATQSRAFVYDFGPGITQQTYPRLDSDSLPLNGGMAENLGGGWGARRGPGPGRAFGRRREADQGLRRVAGHGDVGYYVTMYKHSTGSAIW